MDITPTEIISYLPYTLTEEQFKEQASQAIIELFSTGEPSSFITDILTASYFYREGIPND